MQDYLEQLVLKEVETILSRLPFYWTKGLSPLLFNSSIYAPLNQFHNNCFSKDFYKIADSCTTASFPKTFQSSSFSRRYANLLSNILVENPADHQGDNAELAKIAKSINLSTSATRYATKVNGGQCYCPLEALETTKQYVPAYQYTWLPESYSIPTSININVNVWRENDNQVWQNISSYQGVGERLQGSLIYSQIKIVVVNPSPFDLTTQQGWYAENIIQGMRDGSFNKVKFSAISDRIYSSIELRRARLFFLVGNVKFQMKQSSLSRELPSSFSKNNSAAIQLTPHLKIPKNVSKQSKLAMANIIPENSFSETISQWDSGNLYQELAAGLILAIIEESPLKPSFPANGENINKVSNQNNKL